MNLIAACQDLQGGVQEDAARLYTVVSGWRKNNSGHKLKQERFRLGIRKRKTWEKYWG